MDKELELMNVKCEKFSLKGNIYKCKVVKCYDGDTVHCVFKFNGKYQRFIVRLSGYDYPEIRTKDKDEKKLGYMAKKRLQKLLQDKIVYLHCDDFDAFGRILGTIKINKDDEKSINDIMLKENHGEVYDK